MSTIPSRNNSNDTGAGYLTFNLLVLLPTLVLPGGNPGGLSIELQVQLHLPETRSLCSKPTRTNFRSASESLGHKHRKMSSLSRDRKKKKKKKRLVLPFTTLPCHSPRNYETWKSKDKESHLFF